MGGFPESRAVLCIETSVVYPSINVASKTVGVSHKSIRESIRRGWYAGGFHWCYFDDDDDYSDLRVPENFVSY
eukprot:g32977.t1